MKQAPRKALGAVRIIAGQWRGTRLPVADLPGLRPSSDRVRETLFNWLMPVLPGARVVDLFAGSGALGLEAVSRGASHATLVERDPALCTALQASVQRLDAQARVEVVRADALGWLQRGGGAGCTLAFVDPPFEQGMAAELPALLARAMGIGSWLYVESARGSEALVPRGLWRLHREGSTREVHFALYRAVDQGAADTLGGDASVAGPE